MNYDALSAVLLTLQTISIAFHSGGLYLLKCLRENASDDIQLLLVVNLSVSEVLLNISYIVLFVCNLMWQNLGTSGYAVWHYTQIVSGSTLKFAYYATMVYLTVNKLLEMVLNIDYVRVCTMAKGKILLAMTWLVAVCFSVVMIAINVNYQHHQMFQKLPNETTTSGYNGVSNQQMNKTRAIGKDDEKYANLHIN